MRASSPPLRIAVIGGSLTGCTAAIELARGGFDVTLFERSGEELKDRGAGIGVPPSVVETYIARGLLPQEVPYFPAGNFVRRWRTPDTLDYGKLAWRQPTSLCLLNWGMLYRELRRRVPDGVYRTGHRVIGMQQEREGVTLTIAGYGEQHFDLVVCADGYASLGRRVLYPDIEVGYAGYVLWRGNLDESRLAEPAVLESGIHAVGYAGGHGVFYFVPGADGSTAPGNRLVNWGMYVPVPDLESFMVDKTGRVHEGSLPPGAMALTTEAELKTAAGDRLPRFYAGIAQAAVDTYAYAIGDCQVPSYARGRICLAGDAGSFARPHTGTGAFKGVNDAIALREALTSGRALGVALDDWGRERAEANNKLVQFGNQLGQALVKEIPDWSCMDEAAMERWFNAIVTINTEVFTDARRAG